MTEKRYIRIITGQIYDCKEDKWITEDWDILNLEEDDEVVNLLNDYDKENDELHKENEQLKQLNIPVDEIKDIVVDGRCRVTGIYYD